MKKAFVTGWPVHHSKSPVLHGFWLRQYAINGSYEALAVEPEHFSTFLSDLAKNGFAGGNVTIPHKEIALEHVALLDDAARAIGAVNTLWLENGKLNGSNTDAYGFSANLNDYAPEWKSARTATVLGAGGAARAIIHSLLQEGYERIHIVNRTFSRAEKLSARFGEKCSPHSWNELSGLMGSADFIVNTTSIGMAGADTLAMPDMNLLKSDSIVTDIVYTPLETPFLKTARDCGLKTVDGLGMLLHQAVPGFEVWFGVRPEVTRELRAHVLEAMP